MEGGALPDLGFVRVKPLGRAEGQSLHLLLKHNEEELQLLVCAQIVQRNEMELREDRYRRRGGAHPGFMEDGRTYLFPEFSVGGKT